LKVILTSYHEKLGDIGDEVEVKKGYANNYLIPKGLAVTATDGNRNQMKLVKQAAIKVEARNIKEAEELVKKFEGLQITFVVKTGEEGKLYGSITNKDIAEKIFAEKNIEIDRKKIDLDEHIKELGEYDIVLKLYKEVKTSIKVIVEPDEESRSLIEAYKAEKEKAAKLEEEEKKKAAEDMAKTGEEKVKKGKARAVDEKSQNDMENDRKSTDVKSKSTDEEK
jgi:large subunit ribosomal protein L9